MRSKQESRRLWDSDANGNTGSAHGGPCPPGNTANTSQDTSEGSESSSSEDGTETPRSDEELSDTDDEWDDGYW